MDRRQFLKAGGSAALSLAVGGCTPAFLGQGSPRRPAPVIYPVEVAWERVIRTTTGLRPHRETGFRLKPQRLDHKTVIHNYGHGGAGWSLSWGTGYMAAEMALDHLERRAAVIGCGVVGLTTARQLQRRGFDVTIYAKALPPETTSNMSWAGFTPTSGLVTRRTPEWDAQFRRAVAIAYREHQLLVGRGYGVSWIYSYSATNNPTGGGGGGGGGGGDGAGGDGQQLEPLMSETQEAGSVLLGPGEHPFTTRYARRTPTMRFEPSIYLEAILRDFVTFGGRVVVRTFDTPNDLMLLPENLIVNCTGLGSYELFGDHELIPIKGQLTVLVPQPEVNYSMGGMMPRSDGIVLGHVQQRGVWSLEVDEEEQVRVMENSLRTFSTIRAPTVPPPIVARRDQPSELDSLASITPPPVEAFFGLQS